MTSGDIQSDSFMALLTPIQQYGKNYVFSTITQMQTKLGGLIRNFVNVVAKTDEFSGLRLDGNPLAGNLTLTKIKGTNYTATQIEIPAGSHSVSHQDKTALYNAFIYGFVAFEAYGCPAGMVLVDLQSCVHTPPMDHDGVDNDCDGITDEELLNKKDDDNDGKIDEDYIKIPTVTETQTRTKTISIEPTAVFVTTCPITPTVIHTTSIPYCPTTATTTATTATTESTTSMSRARIRSSQTEFPPIPDWHDRKYLTMMVIICSTVTLGIPICVLLICCFRSMVCCGVCCCGRADDVTNEKEDFVLDVPVSFDNIQEDGSVGYEQPPKF
jgi:hypothetical protein